MTSSERPAALVTGASTGIGRAIAASLIGGGWRVFGSVRKERDAEDAAAALGEAFTPLIFDVTDAAGVARAAKTVDGLLAGATLRGLVNNAGIAVGGPMAYLPLEELQRQLDVNLFGAVRVTQAFLPMLGADRTRKGAPGRIVNMSSVAGRLVAPFMTPYAISKHALEAFTDGLRRELMVHGIDVVAVGPGAIKTPIWAKGEEIDAEKYASTEYYPLLKRLTASMRAVGEGGLPAEAVGDLVKDILEADKPRARYALLKGKLMGWTLPNILPKRIVDRAIAKRFGIAGPSAS